MKYISVLVNTIWIIIVLSKCANPSSPTGGPKDTIPPTVIEMNPSNKTLNFESSKIEISFDENINADRLRQNLVITPNYEGKYRHIVRKNILTVEFEEGFDDSTTYTLNFFNGVGDITEKNPVVNLIYVFSTGDFLDSLQINGFVSELMSQKPEKEIVVGLFQFTDSLDLLSDKPKYFTKADEEGFFQIENIKRDTYKLFAFKDENSNLSFNPESEAYAFLADSIYITENIDSVRLYTTEINVSNLRLISGRPFGRYFEIRYTKPIKKYEFKILNNQDIDYLYHQLVNDDNVIRFYNEYELTETDSLYTIITAIDTVNQTQIDTLAIKFNATRTKPETFTYQIEGKNIQPVTDTVKFKVLFNKPLSVFNSDSIKILGDTLLKIIPDQISTRFNKSRTSLSVKFPIKWKLYEDSIKTIIQNINDSIAIDEYSLNTFNIIFNSATFVSVENDSSNILVNKINKLTPEKYGTIILKASTEKPSYFIQLVDSKLNVKETIYNKSEFIFRKLNTGEYTFRALIDQDEDGIWSPGNLLENKPPEPIIYYKSSTSVRPNFEIYIEDFSF